MPPMGMAMGMRMAPPPGTFVKQPPPPPTEEPTLKRQKVEEPYFMPEEDFVGKYGEVFRNLATFNDLANRSQLQSILRCHTMTRNQNGK
jgi:hypothetical protein